eukprot:TRINITY_DN3299_c0_g2_i2.p1 TRINITY_DN3299_c0_g2~~TRINITY_DN3299_c0_g2_i2.p1  ORF type:complete len:113 (+),score=1.72 TRINITY_DN3299_c0_g2_i2:659-997(+)
MLLCRRCVLKRNKITHVNPSGGSSVPQQRSRVRHEYMGKSRNTFFAPHPAFYVQVVTGSHPHTQSPQDSTIETPFATPLPVSIIRPLCSTNNASPPFPSNWIDFLDYMKDEE